MRTRIAIIVIIAQVAALGYMAGEREWILRTGRTLYLRTAPLDPRDPMRGDYVRFAYEIGHAPRTLWRGGVAGWASSDWRERRAVRNRRVFALVQPDEEGIAQLQAVSDQPPRDGLFLRAHVTNVQPQGLDLRYGVEALFMEQGRAKELEQSRSVQAGVPLNIEVAVSDEGVAVMKGYRWEPLGITLTLDRPAIPRAEAGSPPVRPAPLRGVTVELKNHGDGPVAIVALPDAQSFRLVPNERWTPSRYRWANEGAAVPKPTPDTVRVLRPGESHRERIAFTDPRWWLREVPASGRGAPRKPVPWDDLDSAWGMSFRIEYVPPSRADSAGLPNAALIRHSRLSSRAFSPVGVID